MQPVVERLSPRMNPENSKLLSALVEAMSDSHQVRALNQIPEWMQATASASITDSSIEAKE